MTQDWKVYEGPGQRFSVINGPLEVADCHHSRNDARLIAAAPAMLEVLQTIVRCNGKIPLHWMDNVRAAIKQATGE